MEETKKKKEKTKGSEFECLSPFKSRNLAFPSQNSKNCCKTDKKSPLYQVSFHVSIALYRYPN
jgi:hypothetical protein